MFEENTEAHVNLSQILPLLCLDSSTVRRESQNPDLSPQGPVQPRPVSPGLILISHLVLLSFQPCWASVPSLDQPQSHLRAFEQAGSSA